MGERLQITLVSGACPRRQNPVPWAIRVPGTASGRTSWGSGSSYATGSRTAPPPTSSGVCTAWGEDSLDVDRDGHGPVTIALADVVTGKPVPPRASVRARVEAQEVEEHIGALWSSISTEPLGDWLLRASPPHGGRLRRRGNSALAMREPGIGWADAAFGVRRFYDALDQAPMDPGAARLRRRGHARARSGFAPMGDGDAHAQLASVARALRSVRAVAPDVRASLEESAHDATVSLEDGAATGRGVLSGDWLLIESVVVDPDHRRRGLATAVLAELLDWGASLGATTALLHVEVVNAGADRALRAARLRHPPHQPLPRRPLIGLPAGRTGPHHRATTSRPDTPPARQQRRGRPRVRRTPTRGRQLPAKVWWHRDLAPAHTSRAPRPPGGTS